MVAFKFAMPSGIPGDVQRAEHATIEAQLLDPINYPLSYGVPVKIASGKVAGITTGDTTSTHIHGMYVRPYPTNSAQDGLGVQTIPTKGICDILVRGYILVKVQFNAASAAKDSGVYVRVGTAQRTLPLGAIEGGADTADCFLIAGAYFTGTADAQGICEVAFNI
jgi:hypothetical protein